MNLKSIEDKMTKHAELLLYRGVCNSRGLREGIFSRNATEEYAKNFYLSGMSVVHKEMDSSRGTDISNIDNIVKDEEEALKIIIYVEKNIEGADGIIILDNAMHGKILFERRIRFDGWTKSRENDLLERLKTSKLLKNDAEILLRDVFKNPDKEKLEEVKYHPWKNALTYV